MHRVSKFDSEEQATAIYFEKVKLWVPFLVLCIYVSQAVEK